MKCMFWLCVMMFLGCDLFTMLILMVYGGFTFKGIIYLTIGVPIYIWMP